MVMEERALCMGVCFPRTPLKSLLLLLLLFPGMIGSQLIATVADVDGEATGGAGPKVTRVTWGGPCAPVHNSLYLSLSLSLFLKSHKTGACRVGQLRSRSKYAT